jgi:hypothetical protein
MNIFLSMMKSPSPSFKLETSVENIYGKSILTVKTRKNGDITIISKGNIHKKIGTADNVSYPCYQVDADGWFTYFERFEHKEPFLRFYFTQDGAIDAIEYMSWETLIRIEGVRTVIQN